MWYDNDCNMVCDHCRWCGAVNCTATHCPECGSVEHSSHLSAEDNSVGENTEGEWNTQILQSEYSKLIDFIVDLWYISYVR